MCAGEMSFNRQVTPGGQHFFHRLRNRLVLQAQRIAAKVDFVRAILIPGENELRTELLQGIGRVPLLGIAQHFIGSH
jgi:hypothetical protein